jgi:hypothetical protein
MRSFETSNQGVDNEDETWLWHMSFEHINFDNLKIMAQKKMLKGLPSIIYLN